jgi:hypothetical protein
MKNVRHMTAEDGKIFGSYNQMTMVNPYKCYFIAHYPGGVVKRGANLFDTGWDALPDGIVRLEYQLSTGHIIRIPKYRAYLHLVEVSESIEGAKVFHCVHIKGMTHNNKVVNTKIILNQHNYTKFKIGDIIVSKERETHLSPSWKLAAI